MSCFSQLANRISSLAQAQCALCEKKRHGSQSSSAAAQQHSSTTATGNGWTGWHSADDSTDSTRALSRSYYMYSSISCARPEILESREAVRPVRRPSIPQYRYYP